MMLRSKPVSSWIKLEQINTGHKWICNRSVGNDKFFLIFVTKMRQIY